MKEINTHKHIHIHTHTQIVDTYIAYRSKEQNVR